MIQRAKYRSDWKKYINANEKNHNARPDYESKASENDVHDAHEHTNNTTLPISLAKHRYENIFYPHTERKRSTVILNAVRCPFETQSEALGVPPKRPAENASDQIYEKVFQREAEC